MPINLGAAYLGQTSVNGPPTGFTPEALAGMGGYTVFTSDWTSGAVANVAKSTYQNAVGIVFTLNGMSVSIPGIICNLGSKGAGPDGDGDDKGDGATRKAR